MIKIMRYMFYTIVVLSIIAFVYIINFKKNRNTANEIIDSETEKYINYGYEYGYYTPEYIEKKFGVKDLTNEEWEQMMYYDNHIYEMLLKMTEKGNSWRSFPILKSIKDRYNEKEGILENYDFDSVEYSKETLNDLEEYGSISPISFIITKGKKKTKIYFRISLDGGLDELEKEKEIDLTDENGNELDTRLVCNKENFENIILIMMNENESLNDLVATTDNFKSKYNSLVKAFVINYKPKSSYHGIYNNFKIDEENLTADFYWISDEVEKLYRVYFILDDRSYIDDIKIDILE